MASPIRSTWMSPYVFGMDKTTDVTARDVGKVLVSKLGHNKYLLPYFLNYTFLDKWQATQVDRARSFCCRCCCRVSVARCLSAIMACSMSKDRSEGAVFGMWHWRVGGHIRRKFQPLSSWKSGQKHQNSATTSTVLSSTYVTLTVVASQWALETVSFCTQNSVSVSKWSIFCRNSALQHSQLVYDIINHQATLLTPRTAFSITLYVIFCGEKITSDPDSDYYNTVWPRATWRATTPVQNQECMNMFVICKQ